MDTRPLDQLLRRAEDLRVFPAVVAHIQAVADDPNSSLTDLEQAVARDTALSAKILKVANSPFYGLNRTVGSLRQALFVMGFWATRNMALALTMLSDEIAGDPVPDGLWTHAVQVAAGANALAAEVEGQDPHEAFVCGMLHDIGQLIMLQVDEPAYRPLLERHGPDDGALLGAERELFGCDHARLGAACLAGWNLPERIEHAVSHHHDFASVPAGAPADQRHAAAILYLANSLSRGLIVDEPIPELTRRLADHDAGRQIDVTHHRLHETVELLGSDLSTLMVV